MGNYKTHRNKCLTFGTISKTESKKTLILTSIMPTSTLTSTRIGSIRTCGLLALSTSLLDLSLLYLAHNSSPTLEHLSSQHVALVGLMGLVGGWFGGVVLFSAINAASGWDAVWGYWVISIVCGAIGCWAACHFGKFVVMLSTSGVGSYLFMRSWTLFFPGHYPSESDMMDGGDSMDYDGIFWLFIGVFAVSWVGSYN